MYKKLIAVFSLLLALLFFPTMGMLGIGEKVATRVDISRFIENVSVYKSQNAYANIKAEAQAIYDNYGVDFRILGDASLSQEEVINTLLAMNQNNQFWYGMEVTQAVLQALLVKLLMVLIFTLMYHFASSVREEDMCLA